MPATSTTSLYPPTPRGVPEDLTAPTGDYRLRVVVVLLSLLLFFFLYLLLVLGSAYLMYWSCTSRNLGGLRVLTFPLALLLFLFLVKGFFKRRQVEKSLQIEITEEEQPRLFAFIHRVCDDTGAPYPHKVYLSPDVNAAVFYNSSILSLFLPTPKNLLIGCGLVNMVNLSEFKAVLAHEFGHFAQSSMKLGTYVYTANRILEDLVFRRDWLDEFFRRAARTDFRVAIFAWAGMGILWVLRKGLEGVFLLINFLNLSLSRQMEFNADLVAVSVSGSDAIVHALARLDFASDALGLAADELVSAADHKLYTCDLFYHQKHAAEFLRRQKKAPHLGEPPPVPDDPDLTVDVFAEDDETRAEMWSTHPSKFDREQNAKDCYVRTLLDERSPWALFDEPAAVRERLTYRFYRMRLKVSREVELAAAAEVQDFIDRERAETTYDERYCGIYDGRIIDPGDIRDLVAEASAQPWDTGRLEAEYAKLYPETLKQFMEEHEKRKRELELLAGVESGELELQGRTFKFRGKRYQRDSAERLIRRVDRELKEDYEWLAKLDRKVFQVHYRMARWLGPLAGELAGRYRFHLQLEEILRKLNGQMGMMENILGFLSGKQELNQGQFQEVLQLLRKARKELARCLEEADQLRLPELQNVQAGESLGDYLMEKKLIHQLDRDEQTLEMEWALRFATQLAEARDRARRMHFKGLGAILALQERVAREWRGRVATLPEVLPAGPGE